MNERQRNQVNQRLLLPLLQGGTVSEAGNNPGSTPGSTASLSRAALDFLTS